MISNKLPFPTQERLHELLERRYDDQGRLYFIAKVKRYSIKAGTELRGYECTHNRGFPSEHTRRILGIDGFRQQIAVWNYIYEYGDYDRKMFQIDHIDIDHTNDHHSNLQLVTASQNMMKRKKRAKVTSKYFGVVFSNVCNKWQAQFRGKHLGVFVIEEDAARAYNKAVITAGEENFRILNDVA